MNLFKKDSPGNFPDRKVNTEKLILAKKVYNIVLLVFIIIYAIPFLTNRRKWNLVVDEYSLILLAMIVLSPHTSSYCYIFLLFPASVLLGKIYSIKLGNIHQNRFVSCIYFLALFLLCTGFVIPSVWQKILPINYLFQQFYFLSGLDLLGGLLLLFLQLFCYYRETYYSNQIQSKQETLKR